MIFRSMGDGGSTREQMRENLRAPVLEFIGWMDDPSSVSQDTAELDAVLVTAADLQAVDALYGSGNQYTAAIQRIQAQNSAGAIAAAANSGHSRLAATLGQHWPGMLALLAAGAYAAHKVPRHKTAIGVATLASVVADSVVVGVLPTTYWIASKTGVKLPGWDSTGQPYAGP